MTASQPTLLKIMASPIARSGRVHICQHALIKIRDNLTSKSSLQRKWTVKPFFSRRLFGGTLRSNYEVQGNETLFKI